MSLSEKKEALLDIVKDADEKLTGLLIALANEYNEPEEKYSKEEIESFYKTRDMLLSNPETGYAPDEAHQLIRNKHKNAI